MTDKEKLTSMTQHRDTLLDIIHLSYEDVQDSISFLEDRKPTSISGLEKALSTLKNLERNLCKALDVIHRTEQGA